MCIAETQLFKKCWDYFTASQSSGTLVIGSECSSGSGEWRWCTDLRCCWVANNKTKFLVPASSYICTSVLIITCVDRDSVHCFCIFAFAISLFASREHFYSVDQRSHLQGTAQRRMKLNILLFTFLLSEENFSGDNQTTPRSHLIGLFGNTGVRSYRWQYASIWLCKKQADWAYATYHPVLNVADSITMAPRIFITSCKVMIQQPSPAQPSPAQPSPAQPQLSPPKKMFKFDKVSQWLSFSSAPPEERQP